MVARAEVWWVEFGAPAGSEPVGRRPAIVISDDRFNQSRLKTVTVVPVTSNLRLGDMPGNVRLAEGAGGLDRPSVVNVTQVGTIDRRRLVERSGTIDARSMRRVEDGLRLALRL